MEREHGILDGGTHRHTLKIRRIDRAGIKQHYCNDQKYSRGRKRACATVVAGDS